VIATPYRIIYWREADTVILASFWHQSRAAWTDAEDAD
jgi:hypothetical protein